MPMSLIPVKRQRAEQDNMIPLINIVFLLLIFFMVAGQMKQPQAEHLAIPETVLGAPAQQGDLQVEYNQQQQLFLAGTPITLAEFSSQLATGAHNKAGVRVHADKTLTAEQLDALLDIFREHNINNVNLAIEKPTAGTAP